MILCCGEALIDMLPRKTTAGEDAFAPYAGGAVFNTAVALGRLGAAPGFFCGLSTDLFGQMLERNLTDAGVDAGLSLRSNRPTTLAFVRLVDGQATYTFYDENTALRSMAVDDLPELPDDVKALFFGGISLVEEPCGGAFETLIVWEAPTRVTMIDPNIRPSFITDEAGYRTRIQGLMEIADIVKLSDEDLHWLRGEGEIDDLAGDLIKRGAKIVLITEGAKGATGYTARGKVFAPAPQVSVADTVGAGDTFNAGFLAALQQADVLSKSAIAVMPQDTLRSAIDMGVRAAAITVSRAGANPPWAHEL